MVDTTLSTLSMYQRQSCVLCSLIVEVIELIVDRIIMYQRMRRVFLLVALRVRGVLCCPVSMCRHVAWRDTALPPSENIGCCILSWDKL